MRTSGWFLSAENADSHQNEIGIVTVGDKSPDYTVTPHEWGLRTLFGSTASRIHPALSDSPGIYALHSAGFADVAVFPQWGEVALYDADEWVVFIGRKRRLASE